MNIKETVKKRYGSIIKNSSKKSQSCCEDLSDCCSVPSMSCIPSFGVGNPVDDAQVKKGDIVLDVGSGAGGNCIKAAKLVGNNGKVIGLDMTDEMLEVARNNTANENLTNVEFVKGDAENIPFTENTFDVIISDCVINLVPDKQKVFNELFRVLKSGGRIIISDVVSDKEFPQELKEDEALWCGCVSGAMVYDDYLGCITEAGFRDINVINKKSAGETNGIQLFHGTFMAKK